MATTSIERRVRALEDEVARLRERLDTTAGPEVPWWRQIMGTFANDPHHKKAMELGRAYRESLRPKKARTARRGKGVNHARPRHGSH